MRLGSFQRVACLLAILVTSFTILRSQSPPLGQPKGNPLTMDLPRVERIAARQPQIGSQSDSHLDRTPPRASKGLDLNKMGWSYNCMECHRMISARWRYDRPMVEHENVKLDHGANRFCLNCHHGTNRNAFADYDGSEIGENEVVLLCAKCHGPTYRDWDAGVHGRRNGHWNKEKGVQTRLQCIQCHDPHQPRFAAMKPLPGLRYPARAAKASSGLEHRSSERKHHERR